MFKSFKERLEPVMLRTLIGGLLSAAVLFGFTTQAKSDALKMIGYGVVAFMFPVTGKLIREKVTPVETAVEAVNITAERTAKNVAENLIPATVGVINKTTDAGLKVVDEVTQVVTDDVLKNVLNLPGKILG